jgi:O-antigen ligase
MTTSVSTDTTELIVTDDSPLLIPSSSRERVVYRIKHTLASRFVFLTICVAMVLSALAFGTVHYWSLTLFNLGALTVLVLWVIDAWQLGTFRLSRNLLQLPLLGILVLGLVQLLPLRSPGALGLSTSVTQALSLDPNATRLALIQISTLLVYFSATLVFTDTPHRLHLLVRTILIFGFCLALFGLTQSFTSPTKVFWIRELSQSTAFGPFINRHHFAGYMELTIALPLGLLFGGAVEKEKRLLYIFIVGLMGIALVMTTSRGGIISLVAETLFFVVVTALWRPELSERHSRKTRVRAALTRVGLGVGLLVALFIGVLLLGGEFSIARFIDSVNTEDPTTGRAHFWSVTLDIIKSHPWLGTGLGAFGVVYTQYDSRNGLFRLEQAHNDYLQVLSDAGVIGAALAFAFIVILFRRAFVRMQSKDDFRRGIALAAVGGCFGVLVHSFFDFTLHTTSNALLFLVLAALATLNGRVEVVQKKRKRRRRSQEDHDAEGSGNQEAGGTGSQQGNQEAVGSGSRQEFAT